MNLKTIHWKDIQRYQCYVGDGYFFKVTNLLYNEFDNQFEGIIQGVFIKINDDDYSENKEISYREFFDVSEVKHLNTYKKEWFEDEFTRIINHILTKNGRKNGVE